MKPYLHALSSAKKHGGRYQEYIKFHDWFDQTKAHVADHRHRAVLHSSFGIFLCEQVFGKVFKNSEGRVISVRDIGEQHVLEDLGWIPSMQDYLQHMTKQQWMGRRRSMLDVNEAKEETTSPYLRKLGEDFLNGKYNKNKKLKIKK